MKGRVSDIRSGFTGRICLESGMVRFDDDKNPAFWFQWYPSSTELVAMLRADLKRKKQDEAVVEELLEMCQKEPPAMDPKVKACLDQVFESMDK